MSDFTLSSDPLTPEQAINRLESLYGEATARLHAALIRVAEGGPPPTPDERALPK